MLKYIRLCGNFSIDTRIGLCCDSHYQEYPSDNAPYTCCGTNLINENTQHCCMNTFTVNKGMVCCGTHPTGKSLHTTYWRWIYRGVRGFPPLLKMTPPPLLQFGTTLPFHPHSILGNPGVYAHLDKVSKNTILCFLRNPSSPSPIRPLQTTVM